MATSVYEVLIIDRDEDDKDKKFILEGPTAVVATTKELAVAKVVADAGLSLDGDEEVLVRPFAG